MKIFYTSDLHLDFYTNTYTLNKCENLINRAKILGDFKKIDSNPLNDVLIIAGDLSHYNHQTVNFLTVLKKHFAKIFIVTGNHDFYNVSKNQKQKYKNLYDRFNELKNMLKSVEGIYFLDGDVIEYNGIKFGGAMGWYDCSYYYKLTQGMYMETMLGHWKNYSNDAHKIPKLKDPSDIFSIEIKKIEKVIKQKPDVMITHFCPISESIVMKSPYKNDRGSGYYCFDGSRFWDTKDAPKLWIYGHMHDNFEIEIFNTHFSRNPLGYNGENKEFELKFKEGKEWKI